MTDFAPEPARWTPAKLAMMAGMALLGAAVGAGFALLTEGQLTHWPDELAALVGVVCVSTGVIAAGAVLLRPCDVPSGCAWLQVAAMVLAGAMLLLPIFAPAGWPPEAVFAAVMALLAVQTAVNLLLWRWSDELMRRVIVETGALSFWGLQAALFAWAVAERLALVQPITAWALIGVLMTAYLVASVIVAIRRGLANP